MRNLIALIIICFYGLSCTAFASGDGHLNGSSNDADKNDILYQVDLYGQASEHLSSLFQQFSEGDLEADPALEKVILLRHEYIKLAEPVPVEAERLSELVRELLSQVENYFIYFKRTNRENIQVDLKIVQIKEEISRETQKLQYEDM